MMKLNLKKKRGTRVRPEDLIANYNRAYVMFTATSLSNTIKTILTVEIIYSH